MRPLRVPEPVTAIEAINEYKQPACPHKGQPGGASANRAIPRGFAVTVRDDGQPCPGSGIAITWLGSASTTAALRARQPGMTFVTDRHRMRVMTVWPPSSPSCPGWHGRWSQSVRNSMYR